MDVSPRPNHRVWICALLLFFSSCGNRFDLSTERGRQARIDEANAHLSRGECAQALEAITPIYDSTYVNDEVRVVTASAHACSGTFNMLTLLANLAGATNYFSTAAKSLGNSAGDASRAALYRAADVLTQNNAKASADRRGVEVNNYMVFLQLGVLGAILRNYGAPTADGSQTSQLIYVVGVANAAKMSNEDACALAATFSIITESLRYSSLDDDDTTALGAKLEATCVSAGLTSCSIINKDRASCDDANADSDTAEDVVTGVNASW